jgi:hypothetical protein
MKYYFLNEDSECHSIEWFKEYMLEYNLDKLEVFRAVKDPCKDYFFCQKYGELGDTGNCGKECKNYEPRNGKSGCCKHHTHCNEQGEKVTLEMIIREKKNINSNSIINEGLL